MGLQDCGERLTERGRGWPKVPGLSTCWVLAPCREMRKYGREWRTLRGRSASPALDTVTFSYPRASDRQLDPWTGK